MRIVKEHDVRRNEIIDAAEKLFYKKGYEACRVNDILKAVGIAKGTFYHYFKSKEEALDAIVEKNIDLIVDKIEKGLSHPNLNPIEKLMGVFLSMRMDDDFSEDLLEELHKTENALLHEKNLCALIKSVSPILEAIVKEGNDKKVWFCEAPRENMDIFLAAALTLTDGGIFEVDEAYQHRILTSLILLLEKMLNLPKETLVALYQKHW